MKTKERTGFNEWAAKLPIPKDLKKVEEIDNRWQEMKRIHEASKHFAHEHK